MNKDLILRENLALERTRLAIHRTSLSYLRSAMYFVVAGVSLKHALHFAFNDALQWIFIGIATLILVTGTIVHINATKKLKESRKHIGEYLVDIDDTD